jgi:cellulose synthase/poly-beta-1,6-N-acetylglucosamine synthase-like glycosyltransferase/HEAT repeat protein
MDVLIAVTRVIFYVVLVYYLFINTTVFLMMLLSLSAARVRQRKSEVVDWDKLAASKMVEPISILVPAYNEEVVIADSLRSLLSLKYPRYEVIVINDGSKDRTLDVLIKEFSLVRVHIAYNRRLPTEPLKNFYVNPTIPNLIVVDKENGGKDDALNVGINVSHYPLVCSVDADTILEEDALLKVAMPFFEDRDMVATGGHVRLRNGCKIEKSRLLEIDLPREFIPLLQIVEYTRSFVMGRVGWNALNALLIISGAFGLFRKDLVIEIGGYQPRAIGEDMELVVHLHHHLRSNRIKGKFRYVPDAICWTEAPTELKGLGRQRSRWQQGLLTSLSLYRDMILNPRYGLVGMVAIPYFLLFELLTPLAEVLGYILLILLLSLGFLEFSFFYSFVAITVGYGTFLSLAAVFMDRIIYRIYPKTSQFLKMLLFAALENFGYHHLNVWWRLRAFWNFYFKEHFQHAGWQSPQRIGTGAAVDLGKTGSGEKEEKKYVLSPFVAALRSDRWGVRKATAKTLIKALGQECLPHLIPIAMGRGEDDVEALLGLGEKKVDEALSMLSSKEPHHRLWGSALLGDLIAPRGLGPLISALVDEVPSIRYSSIESLGKIGDARGSDPLLAILREDDLKAKYFSIVALGRMGYKDAIVQLIVFLEDYLLKHATIEALANMGDEGVVEPLKMIHEGADLYTQQVINKAISDIKAISSYKDRDTLQIYRLSREARESEITASPDISEDEMLRRRRMVMDNLIKYGDSQVVGSLVGLIRKGGSDVQLELLDAIDQAWQGLFNLQIELLYSDHPAQRIIAARTLGEMLEPFSCDALLGVLDDEESFVRYQAVESLGRIGDAKAVDRLLGMLDHSNDLGLVYLAIEALGLIGSDRATPAILSRLNEGFLTQIAIEALGRIGDVKALGQLYEATQSDNPLIKDVARRAMSYIDQKIKYAIKNY